MVTKVKPFGYSEGSARVTALPAAAVPRLPLQLLLQGPQPLLPVAKFTGVAEVVVQLLLPGRPASLHNTPHTKLGCSDALRAAAPRQDLRPPHPPPGASQTAPSASETALASGHPRPSAQISADLHTGTRRHREGPTGGPRVIVTGGLSPTHQSAHSAPGTPLRGRGRLTLVSQFPFAIPGKDPL